MKNSRFYSPDDPKDIPDEGLPVNVLVFVNGGSFDMGSNDWAGTRPIHRVQLSSFYISPVPVTQEQWQEIMGAQLSNWVEPHSPVTMVSWYKAVEYCNQRSLKEGLQQCYKGRADGITCDWSANGYRLPTEAEWEYAARGGMGAKDFIYAGSHDIEEVAWFGENSGDHAHTVAKKKPNSLKLYDLSGNVREWCWDWHSKYEDNVPIDPHGPASGSSRIIRGGSYADACYICTVFVRMAQNPGESYLNNGFRVVRFMR